MTQPVLVVGVGGDGPDGLSPEIRERIAEADQLWGSERLLSLWPDHRAEKITIRSNIETLAEQLKQRGEKRVAVLSSGDPGFYGIAGTLARHLPAEELEIVPQVSSLQWAFARTAIPWNDAVFTSAHARPLSEVIGWAKRAPKLGILTDPKQTPALIAQALLNAGVEDCRAIVAENLGSPDERLVDTRLSGLPGMDFAPLSVLLLVHEPYWRPCPLFAPRPDDNYAHRRGLITKADIRALVLARLALCETDIIWDVGAGSGALSVEMAEIAWRGRVYAIEQDPENLGYIRENIRRFGILNVEVVEGEAPEALKGLPQPLAVFVGGTGGRMKAILKYIAEVAAPGCYVIANLTTLENLNEALETMHELNWGPEVLQASLAQGTEIGGLTRLAPLNPVFILLGEVI